MTDIRQFHPKLSVTETGRAAYIWMHKFYNEVIQKSDGVVTMIITGKTERAENRV